MYVCEIKHSSSDSVASTFTPWSSRLTLVLGVCVCLRALLWSPGCHRTHRGSPASAPRVLRSVYHYAQGAVACALQEERTDKELRNRHCCGAALGAQDLWEHLRHPEDLWGLGFNPQRWKNNEACQDNALSDQWSRRQLPGWLRMVFVLVFWPCENLSTGIWATPHDSMAMCALDPHTPEAEAGLVYIADSATHILRPYIQEEKRLKKKKKS